MGWLNALVSLNIPTMIITFDTFQSLMGWLNDSVSTREYLRHTLHLWNISGSKGFTEQNIHARHIWRIPIAYLLVGWDSNCEHKIHARHIWHVPAWDIVVIEIEVKREQITAVSRLWRIPITACPHLANVASLVAGSHQAFTLAWNWYWSRTSFGSVSKAKVSSFSTAGGGGKSPLMNVANDGVGADMNFLGYDLSREILWHTSLHTPF
jgi:hypothetical protein